MAYVIARTLHRAKDTACVDACPVDCIHPKKNTTYDETLEVRSRLASGDHAIFTYDTVALADGGRLSP